jgi:hypothetical protein
VAHIEKYVNLISLPPFQRGATHHICMAHIQYAPLIDGLSVVHIECAPRITLTEVGPVGPMWGPLIINGAYILICSTNRANIHGAFRICATDKTGYFVHDPSGRSHMVFRGAFYQTCAISSKSISGAYFTMRH